MKGVSRLVVFSSVSHFVKTQTLAHAGFVKEIDIWAKIFDSVLLITISDSRKPTDDAIPYSSDNIRFFFLDHQLSTDGFHGKFLLLFKYPIWILKCLRTVNKNDILMARGPDSIGLLGVIVGILTGLPRFGKYADQWANFQNEPIGYRIQKMVYKSKVFGGPVQIYGTHDPKHLHLVPFITSSVTKADWVEADNLILQRVIELPFQLLFVGRLVSAKGVDLILKAIPIVREKGCEVILHIAGDGPEKKSLVELAQILGISTYVSFCGNVGWETLKLEYAQSHCFIHSSRKEGFGKVLVEAMTFSLPIIASDVGITREILEPQTFGCVIPPNSEVAIANQIIDMCSHYADYKEMGLRARQKAQSLLLEGIEEKYRIFVNGILNVESNKTRNNEE